MLLNQPRAIAAMEQHGLEALIATHPNHVTYATNYGGHSPRIYLDRLVFAILPCNMKAALLAPIGDAPYLAENRAPIWVPEIWTYGTSKITWPDDLKPDADERRLIDIIQDRSHNAKSFPDLVARVLEIRGLDRAVIGLDESGLSMEAYEKILKACPNVNFRPALEIWQDIELIKTEEELDRLRKGAVANEAAVGTVMNQVREGISEAELMQVYRMEVARHGGALEFWNTAGGRRSGGFFPSGNYRLQKGDLYRYDAGMVLKHYHADTGGVCVLGEPTKRQREIYTTIEAGMDAALAAVRPGATYEDVWRAGVNAVKDLGIRNYDVLRTDLGHGIGIEPRVPSIAKGNQKALEAGMVINVEVPYYEIGYGGFQIEYTLLVTPSGYEFLIPAKRKLLVVDP
jgi:Xaa-Pro dipeptidase